MKNEPFTQYSFYWTEWSKAEFLVFFPAGIYLLKVNNGNTGTRGEIGLKLTIKTSDTYFTPCSSVSMINFEHVIACWGLVLQRCK